MIYKQLFLKAKKASQKLSLLTDEERNRILSTVGENILQHKELILRENQKDLDRMNPADPKYDRLQLTSDRIDEIVADLNNVTTLSSPLERILSQHTRPNGMQITKISVPFGVIGVIYEARPNVSLDVFSLCFKSGNACILKGGSDAEFSNIAIVNVIQQTLAAFSIPEAACILMPIEREATTALLNAVGMVDLIIPRGSQNLIQFVRDNSKIPVIETGAGICHTYFDKDGDKEKGQAIITNAKTRRVSVCNALDCLIIHKERLADLPFLCDLLKEKSVIIYADELAFKSLQNNYPEDLLEKAIPESFGTEFLDYKMSIKTVDDMEEALEHIARYSSKHSECIVSENKDTMRIFQNSVDSACIYENVSTAFTDGAQFGLGAEIGISTQKLHARGPMALEELTTYKWVIRGNGQVRS